MTDVLRTFAESDKYFGSMW